MGDVLGAVVALSIDNSHLPLNAGPSRDGDE